MLDFTESDIARNENKLNNYLADKKILAEKIARTKRILKGLYKRRQN